jgi:hypothetical protein
MCSLDVQFIHCDAGDTTYRTERWNWFGRQFTDTATTRVGGASDGNTPISWRIVSNAGVRWEFPYESLPISIWNNIVGTPITVTLQGIWAGPLLPMNDEIWMDIQYYGTSGYPLSSKATTTKADWLTAGEYVALGSGLWSGSTTPFTITTTIVPQERGPITIYVCVGRPSSTYYIDPKPLVG